MSLTGGLLLDTAVAMAALVVGVIFLIFRNELSHAHDAASHGSLVVNTRAGPIEVRGEQNPGLEADYLRHCRASSGWARKDGSHSSSQLSRRCGQGR